MIRGKKKHFLNQKVPLRQTIQARFTPGTMQVSMTRSQFIHIISQKKVHLFKCLLIWKVRRQAKASCKDEYVMKDYN